MLRKSEESRDPTLTVFPETVKDLDILKERTGATKKWILRDLVRKEVQRIRESEEVGIVAR